MELQIEAPGLYKNFLRMDHASFQELLELIKPDIEKEDTYWREAIHAGQRLAVTLRFLATGSLN